MSQPPPAIVTECAWCENRLFREDAPLFQIIEGKVYWLCNNECTANLVEELVKEKEGDNDGN